MIMRALGLALALGVGTACLLLPATPASAHASLRSSNPAAGSVVPNAPAEVTLTFSEPVNVALGRVVVLDPDGKAAHDGKPTTRDSGKVVVAKLRDDLRGGTFLVSFRVVSADGHPVSGGITFSIGAPSKRAAEAEDPGEAQVDTLVRLLLSAGKYAGYVGLVLLVGAVLVLRELWPRRLSSAGPSRLAWVGWGLLFGGTAVSVLAQAPYGTGQTLTNTTWDEVVSTATSGVGPAQVIRLGLLLAGIPVIRLITTGRALGGADQAVLGVFFAVLLLTWPLAGHAAASPARFISIPADAIHVGAMAIWLGGLVVLARYLLPAARVEELELVLPTWSRWALYAVVALAFTGTLQALIEVGTLTALVDSLYGRLVIAKVVGFAGILAVAYFGRSWVRSRFPMPSAALPVAAAVETVDTGDADGGRTAVEDGDAGAEAVPATATTATTTAERAGAEDPSPLTGARAFRLRLFAEVGIAAVVLALATALVQTSPGRTEATPEAGEALATDQASSTTVKTKKLTVQIDLDPASTGNNSLHLYAFTPDGKPQPVLEWKASTSLPARGVTNVDIPVLPITANHAVGELQLPTSGEWAFKFTVRTSDVDQETVGRVIVIK